MTGHRALSDMSRKRALGSVKTLLFKVSLFVLFFTRVLRFYMKTYQRVSNLCCEKDFPTELVAMISFQPPSKIQKNARKNMHTQRHTHTYLSQIEGPIKTNCGAYK
jgi:hypothetical protein